MKIVHICLGNCFADGYSYQENMLTKWHKKMGLEVSVIASPQSFDDNGKAVFDRPEGVYFNEDSVKITRIPYLIKGKLCQRLKLFRKLKATLIEEAPDILFIHNCQFLDITKIKRYLNKHKNVKVFVDNHADFANSAQNGISRFLHTVLWRRCAHLIEPYTTLFYGVLPARVDFLKHVYKLPSDKCELLVMGADDDLVNKAYEKGSRVIVRGQLGLKEGTILIITGGKINKNRPETINLMRAIADINNVNIHLLVFGTVDDEYKAEFDSLCSCSSITYIGWIKSEDTYNYFAAADLAVFPGLHSVMWEQSVAQGLPCIFRDIKGFHHVDIGGNADFISDVSVQGLKDALLKVIDNPVHFQEMKKAAEKNGMKVFSYKDIARRSIEQ